MQDISNKLNSLLTHHWGGESMQGISMFNVTTNLVRFCGMSTRAIGRLLESPTTMGLEFPILGRNCDLVQV
jgi:hypothetical protein